MSPSALRFPAVLAAVLTVLVGCGGDGGGGQAASAPGTYVGKLEGTDAFVAVISNGKEVTGYVCDGGQLSMWLGEPDLTNGQAELVSRRGEPLGVLTIADGTASGEVRIADNRYRFRAQPATGAAGLYRVAEGTPGTPGFSETGWIVLGDGSERGGTNFIDPTADEVVSKPAPKRTSATKLDSGFIDPTVNE